MSVFGVFLGFLEIIQNFEKISEFAFFFSKPLKTTEKQSLQKYKKIRQNNHFFKALKIV